MRCSANPAGSSSSAAGRGACSALDPRPKHGPASPRAFHYNSLRHLPSCMRSPLIWGLCPPTRRRPRLLVGKSIAQSARPLGSGRWGAFMHNICGAHPMAVHAKGGEPAALFAPISLEDGLAFVVASRSLPAAGRLPKSHNTHSPNCSDLLVCLAFRLDCNSSAMLTLLPPGMSFARPTTPSSWLHLQLLPLLFCNGVRIGNLSLGGLRST